MVINKNKKNYGKKTQMKIQQTAFMLVAVTLFFVFVGLFVLSFSLSGLRRSASDLQEENAVLLVTKLANSPEFSCGNSFRNAKLACVDADKLMALKGNIDRYSEFWGVTDIKVMKIYPSNEEFGEISCTLVNYPNCNVIKLILEESLGTYESSFVSLCRKDTIDSLSYDKCEMARLMVSYEVIS